MNPLSWLNSRVGDVQRRWPVLRKLDDANWKTWAWHSVFAVGFGYVLGLLPWVTMPLGMHVVMLMYLKRELSQTTFDKWDVIVPLTVVETVSVWIYLR